VIQKMKNRIMTTIIILLSFILGLTIGWFSSKYFKSQKTNNIRTDTVTVVDTTIYSQLVPYLVSVPKYVPLKDTVIRNDTIYIPILQKVYKGQDYKAWVSGYNAALDSIQIYPKTLYINKSNTRRWGLGLMGGYGFSTHGLTPFVGVGLYYKIF